MSKTKPKCSFNPCDDDVYGKMNVCKGHYQQQYRGQELKPLRKMGLPLQERLDRNTLKTDGCWLWTGSKLDSGHGRITVERHVELAHRMAFQLHYGYLPELVDHQCGNSSCVRPEHLREATKSQNGQNLTKLSSANTTGYRGVWFNKRLNRYQAEVHLQGIKHYAGVYKTPEEANQAAVAKRLELFTHNEQDRQLKS